MLHGGERQENKQKREEKRREREGKNGEEQKKKLKETKRTSCKIPPLDLIRLAKPIFEQAAALARLAVALVVEFVEPVVVNVGLEFAAEDDDVEACFRPCESGGRLLQEMAELAEHVVKVEGVRVRCSCVVGHHGA